jgi:hypothetical protein
MKCPWFITGHAVRRYQELVSTAAADFPAARDELIEVAAAIWERYQRNPDLKPTTTRTGAYHYRGGLPLRLQVIVSPRLELVDVVGSEQRRAPLARRA